MSFENFKNRSGEFLDTSFHPGTIQQHLVLLGHGVTGNKDRPLLVAVAKGLAQKGWPCLRITYAGGVGSGGKFEDSNITKNSQDLEDIIAALPSDVAVAYCGHSMGGAVGVITAARNKRIKCLVSLAGMVMTKNFYTREFSNGTPGTSCMWDDPNFPLSKHFAADLLAVGDTLKYVSNLKTPFLLIHGTNDDVVLPEDSEAAFEAAAEPKKIIRIQGAEHSFGDESFPQIIEAVDEWLNACPW